VRLCVFFVECCNSFVFFFFFNDTATTEIYTLSLHDALPISNAIRHSGARRAEITLRPGVLEIADDGRGAPPPELVGNGLTGLRERAQAVGGTVEAGAGPSGGFRLVVRVPPA